MEWLGTLSELGDVEEAGEEEEERDDGEVGAFVRTVLLMRGMRMCEGGGGEEVELV